tara:strand:+ start:5469 stop:6656 length:1188 start_codon:yes stop_codon:yes gene_type:complete
LTEVANNSVEVDLLPEFTWQKAVDPDGDNVSYNFYLDTDSEPSTQIGSNLTRESLILTDELALNTTYYWYVEAKDTEGNIKRSTIFTFKTIERLPNESPENFSLLTPENNSIDVVTLPLLSWEQSTDPDGDSVTYAVYLDQDEDPKTIIASDLSDTSFELSNPLEGNKVYYWKVIANDSELSKESEIFQFTTEENFDGTISAVENFYSAEHVQALEDLGISLNLGDNPPSLEGAYLISPAILVESSVPGDAPGMRFPDYRAEISNQNNESLTLDYYGQGGFQIDEGDGSFISGEGNNFTIYLKTTSQIGSYPVETTFTISGTVVEGGFADVRLAALMLDDKGDPQHVYISNDTGRLIEDGDGFSPKLEEAAKLIKASTDKKMLSGGVVGTINHNN